jgi:hypothetical protein
MGGAFGKMVVGIRVVSMGMGSVVMIGPGMDMPPMIRVCCVPWVALQRKYLMIGVFIFIVVIVHLSFAVWLRFGIVV